jgi:hypothetical protein
MKKLRVLTIIVGGALLAATPFVAELSQIDVKRGPA